MALQGYTFTGHADVIGKKLQDIRAYCAVNGIRASDGAVIRALIEGVELAPDLLGMIRAQQEREKARKRERKAAAKGTPESAKRRSRR